MTNSIAAGTLIERIRFSPRYLMWAIMAVYALIEFYPVNYGVSTVAFFGVTTFCLAWLLAFPGTKLINKANFEVLIFFAFWLAYSLFSYIWAIDRDLALENSLLIFRYLGVFVIFDALFRDHRILRRAHLVMAGILVLYILTALWEMLTFQHLPSSRYYGMPFYYVPTGPFYNQNNLAAFMIFIMPCLLFLPKLYRHAWLKLAVAGATLLILVIITVQGARIAMLAAGAMLLAVGLLNSSVKTKLITVLVILLAVMAFFRYAPPGMKLGWKLVQREIESFGTEAESAHMSSLKIRRQLVDRDYRSHMREALLWGLGVGTSSIIWITDREYRTAGITNAHNWFLEILGNYGILILAAFVYIYLRWLWLLWLRYKASEGRERNLNLAYLWVLLMFIPASALPSSIRWNHHIWIIFAAINAVCNSERLLLKETK
ncbi:MAG: O-antigen ligase family protein [Candidatus Cloacimonetes bacterium]|nr:O-antigen ligase family protein [Candidatus Cloacimonadota bacterium]